MNSRAGFTWHGSTFGTQILHVSLHNPGKGLQSSQAFSSWVERLGKSKWHRSQCSVGVTNGLMYGEVSDGSGTSDEKGVGGMSTRSGNWYCKSSIILLLDLARARCLCRRRVFALATI